MGIGHFEPLRHYAEAHLRLDPGPRGSGVVFGSECSEDELDRNWQRLILTNAMERDHLGVLTGAPLTDVRIDAVHRAGPSQAHRGRGLSAGNVSGRAAGTHGGGSAGRVRAA